MPEQEKPFEVTPELLDRVRLENIRNYQIGGKTDGVTPERAEQDYGIESDERFLKIRQNVADRQSAQKDLSRVRPTRPIRGREVGDAELDGGRTPEYHRPIEENLPTDEHRRAAREHLPGIKEILRQAQIEQPKQDNLTQD